MGLQLATVTTERFSRKESAPDALAEAPPADAPGGPMLDLTGWRAPGFGQPSRGRARRIGLGVVLVVAASCIAVPAQADPDYPSADDVARSKANVASAAASVGRIQAQLAQADARLERLGVQAAEAVEAYNGARLKLAE